MEYGNSLALIISSPRHEILKFDQRQLKTVERWISIRGGAYRREEGSKAWLFDY
jgi:hypothetical protein